MSHLRYQRLVKALRLEQPDDIVHWYGGGLLAIPEGHILESFCYRLCDDPAGVHAEARGLLARANAWGRRCLDAGSELLILANDIAFNPGPLLSPAHFAEFIQPCLIILK